MGGASFPWLAEAASAKSARDTCGGSDDQVVRQLGENGIFIRGANDMETEEECWQDNHPDLNGLVSLRYSIQKVIDQYQRQIDDLKSQLQGIELAAKALGIH